MKQKRIQGERYAFKSLGQHFLQSEDISYQIAQSIPEDQGLQSVLEVGPGPGILSRNLYNRFGKKLFMIELDSRFYTDRRTEFPQNKDQIFNEDILKFKLDKVPSPLALIGNYPYNISSQILFFAIDHVNSIPYLSGMFQKELALRVVASPGKKDYGILSVLVQVFYDATYLFDVGPEEFNPPPKVNSGVILLKRRAIPLIPVEDYPKFKTVVKIAFNQRRKTVKNALLSLSKSFPQEFDVLLTKRPEQISIQEFYSLSKSIFSK